MDITTEEFQRLKDDLSEINDQVSRIEGQVESNKTSLAEILDKYEVKNLTEFKKLLESEQKKAEKVLNDASAYVKDTGDHLSRLDEVLTKTGEDRVNE